ncbi:hypothetical protein NL676_035652 [Syzygium grande]|nr:hypothetical protein NL676_035652 [Syzygium grande]
MKPGSTRWDSVQKEVVKAPEEHGCFEALYDKISAELYNDVFEQTEDLFNLPAETKRSFVNPRKPHDGYVPNRPHLPLYEAMGITGVLDSGGIQKLANLMWPEGNPKFCETLTSYAMRLSELESLITRMVFRSLGVEKYLDSHAESLNHSIRVMRYKAPRTREPQIGEQDKVFGQLVLGHKRSDRGPHELVDEQHPVLFKPFDEIGLLQFAITEQGLKAESTLKAYCGV